MSKQTDHHSVPENFDVNSLTYVGLGGVGGCGGFVGFGLGKEGYVGEVGWGGVVVG